MKRISSLLLSLIALVAMGNSVPIPQQAQFFSAKQKPASGGGGGSFTLLTHNKGTTSATMDDTGATILVAYVAYNTGPGTLSSSRGNTFTAISPEWGGGASGSSTMYVCINPSNPGTGDTISTTSAGAPSMCIASFSGTATAVDQSTGQQVSGTSCQPGSITTTVANEVLFAGLNWYNASPSGSVTVDSSFTITDQNTPGSVFGAVLAYRVVSSTLTVNPTFTTPQSGGSSCGQISIK